MRPRSILILVATVLCALALAGCARGNDISGEWFNMSTGKTEVFADGVFQPGTIREATYSKAGPDMLVMKPKDGREKQVALVWKSPDRVVVAFPEGKAELVRADSEEYDSAMRDYQANLTDKQDAEKKRVDEEKTARACEAVRRGASQGFWAWYMNWFQHSEWGPEAHGIPAEQAWAEKEQPVASKWSYTQFVKTIEPWVKTLAGDSPQDPLNVDARATLDNQFSCPAGGTYTVRLKEAAIGQEIVVGCSVHGN